MGMEVCIEDQHVHHHHQQQQLQHQQLQVGFDKQSALLIPSGVHAIKQQMPFTYPLLENVHQYLPPPTANGRTCLMRGKFKYFHYNCDGYNDIGWGCAYRTLQSACSWIEDKQLDGRQSVPSVLEIQQTLVDIGDKPANFVGSHGWIGSLEVFYVIDTLYDVSCRILHVGHHEEMKKYANILKKHFEDGGGLVMMGGDEDTSSKGIAGLHISANQAYFLVVDPHFVGKPKSIEELIERGYVRWQHSSEFVDSSFYNLCVPQL